MPALVLRDDFSLVDKVGGTYTNSILYDIARINVFRFNGLTPEELVRGRERIYFEYLWNDLAANKGQIRTTTNSLGLLG